MGRAHVDGRVDLEDGDARGLLDGFLLERGELDDLLRGGGLREYLFVLDLLHVLLLADGRVVVLEQHLLVVQGAHPRLSVTALIVQGYLLLRDCCCCLWEWLLIRRRSGTWLNL